MDRALQFIRRCANAERPFLSLVWFHTPHTPVVAGNEDRAPYSEHPMDAQHWHGSIAAMDRQVGRLRAELRGLGIADNTIVWFCSDNGPSYIHDWNSAGPLRGKKATLWEGGIRVPAIVEWPARFSEARAVDTPMSTSDFYPTLLDIVGVTMPDQPPLDGANVLPILDGKADRRPGPIAFQSPLKGKRWEMQEGKESMVLVDGRYKLASFDGGESYQLYDLVKDVAEETDVSAEHPERVETMKKHLETWMAATSRSAKGEDYK
jgi:arylsulfatase A-like enzyme